MHWWSLEIAGWSAAGHHRERPQENKYVFPVKKLVGLPPL